MRSEVREKPCLAHLWPAVFNVYSRKWRSSGWPSQLISNKAQIKTSCSQIIKHVFYRLCARLCCCCGEGASLPHSMKHLLHWCLAEKMPRTLFLKSSTLQSFRKHFALVKQLLDAMIVCIATAFVCCEAAFMYSKLQKNSFCLWRKAVYKNLSTVGNNSTLITVWCNKIYSIELIRLQNCVYALFHSSFT